MKKKSTFILVLSSFFLLFSCGKEKSTPTGQIVFWIDRDNGCGPINVSIDGSNVGQINNWQTFAPSNCTSSNTLLVVTTTQGNKSVTFKNSCNTLTTTINLNSSCYVYQLR